MKTINFYSTTGEHGCFSNFSRHPVRLKGKLWLTSEHYFQAQKFVDTTGRIEKFNKKFKGGKGSKAA